jgi:hypothetical protein
VIVLRRSRVVDPNDEGSGLGTMLGLG